MGASERAVEYFIREKLQQESAKSIQRKEILNNVQATPEQVDFVLRHLEQHSAISIQLNGVEVYVERGNRAVV